VSNSIIHKGNLIEVHKEQVDLPGDGHTHFDIVKHPGGAVIAAINDKEEMCILRQWRHAVGQTIWELPAGCLEIDEPPIDTAKRELEEEAGVIASSWRELGTIVTSPGFCNEVLYLFEARDLSDGTLKLDDAEVLEAHWFPVETILSMARGGEIIDAKTLALLSRI